MNRLLTVFVLGGGAMSAWASYLFRWLDKAGAPGGGRGGQPAVAQAVKQVATPIPAAVEVNGPCEFFETFMDDHDGATKANIPAKDIYAKFGYEAKEFFVSGSTANGVPYEIRIAMPPSGNPGVFHFTQTYAMSAGVIGLEILTSTPAGLAAANEARL
jgi:hypothetical protein